MLYRVKGRIVSGTGEGSYYVSLKPYYKFFTHILGYPPYPGTLNIVVDEKSYCFIVSRILRLKGIKIQAFKYLKHNFCSALCYPIYVSGTLPGLIVYPLVEGREHSHRCILEVISPYYLRGVLGLSDGDMVELLIPS